MQAGIEYLLSFMVAYPRLEYCIFQNLNVTLMAQNPSFASQVLMLSSQYISSWLPRLIYFFLKDK